MPDEEKKPNSALLYCSNSLKSHTKTLKILLSAWHN